MSVKGFKTQDGSTYQYDFDALANLPNLQGEDGATYTPAVAADGTLSWSNDKGLDNPAPVNIMGPAGADGVAATIEITGATYLEYGATPTVTEAADSTAQARKYTIGIPAGKPGAAGYTPVKGVDYWTAEEQTSIIQEVINLLGGTPVFGTVDADNNIVLTGALAVGKYTLKYEDADGNLTEVGVIEVTGDTEPSYTNLADPTDSAWVLDKRYNSSNALTDFSGGVISNYIDVSGCTSHIAIKGINMKGDNSRIYFYDAVADTPVSYLNTKVSNSVTTADYDESVYIIPASLIATTTLCRFGGPLVGTSEDVVIVIDEDIV